MAEDAKKYIPHLGKDVYIKEDEVDESIRIKRSDFEALIDRVDALEARVDALETV